MVIYKYEVKVSDENNIIDLPVSYKVVHVGMHDGRVYMWIAHDLNEETKPCNFRVVATGQEFPLDKTYIGTAQSTNNYWVWHVFLW